MAISRGGPPDRRLAGACLLAVALAGGCGRSPTGVPGGAHVPWEVLTGRLVLQGVNGEAYLLDADARTASVILRNGADIRSLSLHPNGLSVAVSTPFIGASGGLDWDVFSIPTDQGVALCCDSLIVTPEWEWSPLWLLDGRLAYVARRASEDGAVVRQAVHVEEELIHADSLQAQDVTQLARGPDGSIVADLLGPEGRKLYRIDPETSELTVLVDSPPEYSSLAVSPNGDRLAYSEGLSIWVSGLDGSDARMIAEGIHVISWSPDGDSVLYVAHEFPGARGRRLTLILNLTGGSPVLVLPDTFRGDWL